MTLAAAAVADLRAFLVDAARGHAERGERSTEGLAERVAALDYTLLLASEREGDSLPDDEPIVESIRRTMADAAQCALAELRGDLRDGRHRVAAHANLMHAIRTLRSGGAIVSEGVAFTLVIAGDEVGRAARGR